MNKTVYETLSEAIETNDNQRFELLLSKWETPDPDTVLELLDACVGSPRVSAVLLEFLHRTYSPEVLRKAQENRAQKALGFPDEEEADLTEQFTWESCPDGCRILSYKGTDEEILIPEQIGNEPVTEISQLFFLTCDSASALLVPEGIRTGTLLPREACSLFGAVCCEPEIIFITREEPSPIKPEPQEQEATNTKSGLIPLHFHPEQQTSLLKPGDIVTLGQWISGSRSASSSEISAEFSIEWTILQMQEDHALLAARQVLEKLPMHSFRTGILWDSCDLRNWLNTAFYDAAFTEEERARICPVSVSGSPNPAFGTRNSYTSEDHVFLLSPDEWNSFHDLAAPDRKSQNSCPVWLRMPGLTTQYAVTADRTGKINWQGELVSESTIGVLPAMWVKLQLSDDRFN